LLDALAYERSWQVGDSVYQFEKLLDYLQNTKRKGKLLIDDPVIKKEIAQLAVELEVARLFGLRVACMLEKGQMPSLEASVAKIFGSEVWHHITDKWIKILSLYGQLEGDSELVPLEGRVMEWYFGGVRSLISRGTNDILRNVVAIRGLNMPRP